MCLNLVQISFFELAGVLAGLLSQDPPEKAKIKKLYSHIEQTYISAMRGAILDKHPQWCVQGHQRAAEIYLYQNWPHGKTEKKSCIQAEYVGGSNEIGFACHPKVSSYL